MSGINLAKYAVGASDSFKGTGVWSGIKFDRPPKEDNKKSSEDVEIIPPATANSNSKSKSNAN